MLMISTSFTGCSKDETLVVAKHHADYIGNWQLIDELNKKDYFHLKHVLLTIQGNGNASYLKCDMTKDATGSGNIATREQITLTDPRVISIQADKIVLEQSVSFFNMEYVLEINKSLFSENDTKYIKIEGYTLQKISEAIEWECPELDNIEI